MQHLPTSRFRTPLLQRLLFFIGMVVLGTAQACSSTSKLPPAQSSTEFYQKYKAEAGFKGTTIPVGLVTRLFAKEIQDTTVRAALSNITSVRALTFTPTDRKARRLLENGLTQELDQVLQKENYTAVPFLTETPGALQFKMRQANDQVQEIVGYRKYGNNFLMLQINGRFTRDQVQQLLQKVDPDVFLPLLE
ncbi:DUF4252 domain-containing protein [Rufibacter psychrotolerans]|uniref:DUF4252 domain-containing protein n=1 Tax=Rufibacter psychrotolerans TaxID=2812556 RepID=UPI001967CDF3|nr:DUF4252 domain-containing protein [Rufibacter sp. SYSU D00308]